MYPPTSSTKESAKPDFNVEQTPFVGWCEDSTGPLIKLKIFSKYFELFHILQYMNVISKEFR